jgi:proton-translocating NAD(P)+ transhydrogenase subunit alpha
VSAVERDPGPGPTAGIPKETFPAERRVAVTPTAVPLLAGAGLQVTIEKGAGVPAGFPDDAYLDKGATVASSREEVFGADILVQLRLLGANPDVGRSDLPLLRGGQVVVGMANPLGAPEAAQDLAERGVTAFALELMPRISRAQSMDVLSSQATVSGYKAVLLAAEALPKMFPLMTTAAGTVAPARVLVIGAGVAGLQAIATARRLGAVVEAYDVRPVVKEQVESLGAKFVELDIESEDAEDRGGYAKAQDEAFYRRQQEQMARVVAANDAVITTALVPGQRAPVLVTGRMVEGMAPGSVVLDLAAEQGGNCELTKPGETVVTDGGVSVLGPTDLPSSVPFHASQMFARNAAAFLAHLMSEGWPPAEDTEDQILKETLLTRGGRVANHRVLEALGATEKAAR